MQLSEKITLCLAAWMIIVLFITSDVELEIFFILILIGLIVIKEVSNQFSVKALKFKMNVFILFLLLTFFVLIARRIINIVTIS